MKTKHTQGKWEMDATTAGSISIWNDDERDNGILIGSVYYEAKEAEANAKLIAASPDLLAELQVARNFIDVFLKKHSFLSTDWKEAMQAGIKKMDEAIKKATE